MGGLRWIIGLGALLVAGLALYVLVQGGGDRSRASDTRSGDASGTAVGGRVASPTKPVERYERERPALEEIDAESRAALRELLREADETDMPPRPARPE